MRWTITTALFTLQYSPLRWHIMRWNHHNCLLYITYIIICQIVMEHYRGNTASTDKIVSMLKTLNQFGTFSMTKEIGRHSIAVEVLVQKWPPVTNLKNNIENKYWKSSNNGNIWQKTSHTGLGVNRAKSVITHLVHETVEQSWWTLLVHPEFTLWSIVVRLFDVSTAISVATNSYHP